MSGAEWYADGLRFQCTQCGNCCTGPPGTVGFTAAEAKELARHLGITEKAFLRQYARKVDGNWSLNEHETEHGLDCVFLDRETVPGKAVCGVYEARPTQCRTWPFWPENLRTQRSWLTTRHGTPCPGMDTGPLIPIEAIRIQRDAKKGGWLDGEG
ncbi:MAG: YkgJ family cysteine cluster protein [Planctomycetes bacterium]|nr:YkgJ family cysteine cluster protein [Planctomycetota bacterium]